VQHFGWFLSGVNFKINFKENFREENQTMNKCLTCKPLFPKKTWLTPFRTNHSFQCLLLSQLLRWDHQQKYEKYWMSKPNVSWNIFCHTKILVALTFHFNKFIEDPRGFRDKTKPMPVTLKIKFNIYILFGRCFVYIELVISPGRFPKWKKFPIHFTAAKYFISSQ